MPADATGTAPAPRAVVLRHTAKRMARSGALWGYLFGGVIAASAASYSRIYKTQAERDRLAAAFGANHATSALFGPAPQLQTVAGFTVFKVFMTLSIMGSVWGLLTATKLLRGEEEAGRVELLSSGRADRRGVTVQTLGAIAFGVVVLWAVASLVTAVVGRSHSVDIDAGGALFLVLTVVSPAVMFLAVGALTSQLAQTRRQAARLAGLVLGASYALRMVADAGTGLHWLVWLSPIGWAEELHPLTGPRPWVLVPIGAFSAVMVVAAVALVGHRDLDAGVLPGRDSGRARLGLLGTVEGASLRSAGPNLAWWTASVAALGLLMGYVAKAAGATISGSSVEEVFRRLGAAGVGTAAYLGVVFVMLAVVVTLEAAGQLDAMRAEESTGRLDHVLAEPVTRLRWFAGRVGLAVGAAVVAGVVAGLFAWLGTAVEHGGVRGGALVGAGLNVVPPAVFVVGVGALAIGVRPRRAGAVVYGVLIWSVLVDFVGALASQNHWVLDTSLFHQMASAPAVAPNWTTGAVLCALGLGAMAAGALAFGRRDLLGE
ncbi:MAG: hypothetical protein ACYDA2_02220 [Acidimicrobiales bacterium]